MLANFALHRPPPRPRASTARPQRPPPTHDFPPSTSQPKRARKERGPNWLTQEIFALIDAKRGQYLEELDAVDGRDLMNPEASKWF